MHVERRTNRNPHPPRREEHGHGIRPCPSRAFPSSSGPHGPWPRCGMGTNDRKFFARNQVWDNMLWTCASGVTIWTAYEAGFMWAYANDLLPFYHRR